MLKMNKQLTAYRTMPVSVAMIVFNEKHHIRDLIVEYSKQLVSKLPARSEFLIYTDCPTDGTDTLLRTLQKRYRFRLIEGKKNLGYAKATKKILAMAKSPLIFYSDSSGKHEAKDFWKLLPLIQKNSIVTGKRVSHGNPIIRSVISFFQQLFVALLFRVPMLDYNAGYKLVRKEVLQQILPKCRYLNQSFSSELLIRAFLRGYTIAEVPVVFKKRPGKNTGTNYGNLPGIIYRQLVGYTLLLKELQKARA
jgi:dolichol-phosphate mannosyltransferase